jgi:dihydroorotase
LQFQHGTAQGTVKPSVIEARERGVLFDIGHGMNAFAFKTARAMITNGFYPDTISSDVHALCIEGPAIDLDRWPAPSAKRNGTLF